MSTCPHCGNAMPEIRCGAELTPLKARIFDIVKRSGADGIENGDLYNAVFGNTLRKQRTRYTLKSHIWQINSAIVDSGFRIRGNGGAYRLVREAAE